MNISRHTADEYRRRISLAMNYISQHLETDLPLDVVAKAASFSPFHFHRIFKIVVGETVSEFTRRLRLELAANRLLSSDELTITQIALDCGFSSSQNFAKAFRAFYKMTPSVYRKSKIGNKHSKNEDAVVLSLRHIALGPSEGPTLFEK